MAQKFPPVPVIEGTLGLRDGNGVPVNVQIIELPDGTLQTQSTPADETGAPYTSDNPLFVSDVALQPSIDRDGPNVKSQSIEDMLAMMLAEMRVQSFLMQQAFGGADNLDALRADYLKQER